MNPRMPDAPEMPPPVDFARLAQVAGTDEEKKAILVTFFRIAGEISTSMEEAKRCGDIQRWKNEAHGLKGAAANLGMSPLAELCGRAEEGAETGGTFLAELLRSIGEELQIIAAYIARRQPSLRIDPE